MTEQERKEWLASLNEGDEVLVEEGHMNFIPKIDRITPTRKFRVGNHLYDCDGYRSIDKYYSSRIHPVTQKYLNLIEAKNIIEYLSAKVNTKIPLDKLRRIKAIIEE